jgi:putative FmdB family regulatory protein
MPIYEYQACEPERGCATCRAPFERLQPVGAPPLTACPACGAAVRKCISRAAVGRSVSGLDQRAKSQGFKKLKRLGRGEYEQVY